MVFPRRKTKQNPGQSLSRRSVPQPTREVDKRAGGGVGDGWGGGKKGGKKKLKTEVAVRWKDVGVGSVGGAEP